MPTETFRSPSGDPLPAVTAEQMREVDRIGDADWIELDGPST